MIEIGTNALLSFLSTLDNFMYILIKFPIVFLVSIVWY